MRIYATEQLGATQSLTPEGYLLCEGVPIARTGSQLYAAHELPTLIPSYDGLITVHREEAEVFRPETMASYEGKSVTIGHAFVDPANWGDLTKGTVQNLRRGTSDQYDLLLADLLITDAEAIEKVRVIDADGSPIPGERPLREVSCGYDAEYVQGGPGVAYQRDIIGNHVALVERGRAGPRCSIQDQDGDFHMATVKKDSLAVRLMRALRTGDSALIKRTKDEAEAEMQQMEDEENEEAKKKTEDTLANLVKTVDALSLAVASLAKARTKDADEEDDPEAKKKTADEEEEAEKTKAKVGDAMRDLTVRAEVLAPGFSIPTTDSVATMDSVASLHRRVLATSYATEAGRAALVPLLAGRTLDSLTADAVGTVFVAASEMAKQRNNAAGARSGIQTKDFGRAPSTLAEINKRNADFWKNQN